MDRPSRRYDKNRYETETYFQKSRLQETLKRANQLATDPEKKVRREKQNCVLCHYGSSMAGQAFTSKPCDICETKIMHGNTNIDCVCIDCAKKAGICKHCGADMELKVRRKFSV